MGLARRWDVDDLEFKAGRVWLKIEDKKETKEVDLVLYNSNRVGLDRDDVTKMRDWLTEWLNAAP